jgi:hypothetical protein
MLCTWLVTALVVTGPAIQEASSPPPDTPTKPFARLFRFGSGDRKTGVEAPRFRTVPGKRVGANGSTRLEDETVDVICGTTVVRKSPRIDPRIALPANRGTGIAVRRVEPSVCAAGQRVLPK